jgi:hypothetical protein
VDLGHEYEVDDYTEPLQRYDAGLFYPIRIGADPNGYPHVRREAIAKSFGMPTPCWNCAHSELTPARHSPTRHANYSTDLNNENVMWGINPLDNVNTETKYRGHYKAYGKCNNRWYGQRGKPEYTSCPYLGSFG